MIRSFWTLGCLLLHLLSKADGAAQFKNGLSSFMKNLAETSTSSLIPLTGDTTVSFSVTVDGSTAYCQLSFSTDLFCISHAQVSCQVVGESDMGLVEHAWDFIERIDGVPYDMTAQIFF